ncbi:MAG: right-handed parallel beta-helix repeat-containing protein, partial [Limisphaerales bacterium]
AFAQGNLTPSGTPAPTMKTLEQIEPRIDVAKLAGDAGSHVIISNAGSYYLSTNLAVTKTNGITIAAAGVTLDLNGFEIARVSGSGGDGIRINGGSDRATVRNGTLRGFSYGINGLVAPIVKGCLFEKLAVTSCSFVGIHAGDSARVLDCRAHNNTGTGIVALDSSVISGCTVGNNQGDYGIYAGTGSTISGCTARENQGNHGIYAGLGSTIRDCTAYNNTGTGSSSYGIYGASGVTIIACTSYGNNNTNSPATPSHGIGIYASTGSTVKDCAARSNRGDGIQVASACLVEGNTCNANGNSGDGAGIHSTSTRNRIEANTVTLNDRGIDVDSTASLIIRNYAATNGTNYVIAAASNRYGPIIDYTGAGSPTPAVSGSSAASTVSTTDPWANFAQ